MVALRLLVIAELPEADAPQSLARSNSITQDAGYNPWVPGKVLYIYRCATHQQVRCPEVCLKDLGPVS